MDIRTININSLSLINLGHSALPLLHGATSFQHLIRLVFTAFFFSFFFLLSLTLQRPFPSLSNTYLLTLLCEMPTQTVVGRGQAANCALAAQLDPQKLSCPLATKPNAAFPISRAPV